MRAEHVPRERATDLTLTSTSDIRGQRSTVKQHVQDSKEYHPSQSGLHKSVSTPEVKSSQDVQMLEITTLRDVSLQTEAALSLEHVLARSVEIENTFMEYIMSLQHGSMQRVETPPTSSTSSGINQLVNLSRLVNQLAMMRLRNYRMKQKIEFLQDMRDLQKMYSDYLLASCKCKLTTHRRAAPAVGIIPASMPNMYDNRQQKGMESPQVSTRDGKEMTSSMKKRRRVLRKKAVRSRSFELGDMKNKPSYWIRVKEAFSRRDHDVVDRFLQEGPAEEFRTSIGRKSPRLSGMIELEAGEIGHARRRSRPSLDSEHASAADLINISSDSETSEGGGVFRNESFK